MFTVALIGPDGAGKTTISRRLQDEFPLPIKYIYMGVNRDSSNHMLPTTRLIRAIKRALGAKPDVLGPPDRNKVKARPKNPMKRVLASIKAVFRLANQLSEEWFRQAVAWYYKQRGHVVLFDRHFFSDYHAYDIANGAGLPLSRRIHGFLLQHFYPKPDLVIYLDAPAEVLFARKGEGTVEALERRRQEYLQLRHLVQHFAIVDVTQSPDEVTRDVSQLMLDFLEGGRSISEKVRDVQEQTL